MLRASNPKRSTTKPKQVQKSHSKLKVHKSSPFKKNKRIITTTSCKSKGDEVDLDNDQPPSGIFPKDPKPLFLLCDIQEPFRTTMEHFPRLIQSSSLLMKFAKEMNYDVRVSEQLPFAGTVQELVPIIESFPSDKLKLYKKKKFSMIPDIVDVDWNNYNSVVLFGIESHVCILQTYQDLTRVLPVSTPIFLVTDATYSQRDYDRTCALRTMIDATQVTSEALLYGFMGSADNPHFKAMLPHVKQHGTFIRENNADPKYQV